jgi:hypothetical protein
MVAGNAVVVSAKAGLMTTTACDGPYVYLLAV